MKGEIDNSVIDGDFKTPFISNGQNKQKYDQQGNRVFEQFCDLTQQTSTEHPTTELPFFSMLT